MAPHLVCAVDPKERLRDHDAQGLPQVSRCLCPWRSTFCLATAKGLLLASAYQFWILVVLLSRRYAFLVYTSKAAGASLKSRVELGWSGNTWRNVYACLKIGHPPIRSFNWETHKPCSRTNPYQHDFTCNRSIAAGHCRTHFFHIFSTIVGRIFSRVWLALAKFNEDLSLLDGSIAMGPSCHGWTHSY
jgi:hypothetical protein